MTLHATATKTVKHTIKSGESLYTIAKKNHTTVAALCKLNGIKKGQVLHAGHTLKVPKGKSIHKSKKRMVKKQTVRPAKYVVKSGDTLSRIAKRYHTTVASLRKLNYLKSANDIKPGQILALKASAKKKSKATKRHSKKAEKKLAKTLKHMRTTHIAKVSVKKSHKFSLSDIVFGGSGKLSAKSKRIIALAKQKLGKRYVWGATGQRNTFDCSGLTTYVCKKNGIKLPRRAIQQSKVGKPVKRSELKPGDLVFFDTSKQRKGYVNHVGIYIGNGKFIHASSAKKKVIITSLNKPFYSQRFKGARRVASL